MRKPIFCSNVDIRFYFDDGWTKAELDDLCMQGEVHVPYPQDLCPFFRLDRSKQSCFDVTRLIEAASEVHRGFDKMLYLTDVQYLELLNRRIP